MIEWLKGMFTDINGKVSSRRVCALLFVIVYNGLAIYTVCVNHANLDYLAYGQGASMLVAALGVWFGLEKPTTT